jgi:chemotaxis protein methyltransferase CheR
MPQLVDDSLLNHFAEFMATVAGWSFPPGRRDDLLRGISTAAAELGQPDAKRCMQWLMEANIGRREIEILARYLTVGETYFYREPAVFAALEYRVLPELIEARRKAGNLSLRLWCAACCTGEEAYSLAMVLSRLLPDLEQWHITLLATDINAVFLQRAADAVYKPWSFRNAPRWLQGGYFKVTPAGFALQPRIKRMVTFAYLNLVDDSYPSVENNTNAMDLILCRNVLMYFSPEQTARVVRNLQHALVPGGWLVVSSTETSHELFKELNTVNFPDAVLYRKLDATQLAPSKLQPLLQDELSWLATTLPAPEPAPEPEMAPAPEAPAPPAMPQPYLQAQALYQEGRYTEAAAVLEGNAESAPAKLLLARAAANLGQLELAASYSEQAIAADKLNPGCQYLLAAILDEQGQPEAAYAALKRALYLDQSFVLAHFSLGNLAKRLGKANATKHFDNALRLLADYAPDALLPESEGITAGRLAEIIQAGRARE